MKRGPSTDISIPDELTLSSFYLEENLACGRGGKVAAYYEDQIYTFSELCQLANRAGNVLKALGVGFQDRVLLILQDSPEWLAAWFGTMKIGGVATHAYTYLRPADYEYFIGYVQPKVVVVDRTTLAMVREGANKVAHPVVILVAGRDRPPLEKGEVDFGDRLATASPLLAARSPNKRNLAFWNFSGGTTGEPKGVPHSHEQGVVGFESYQSVIQYTPQDVVLRVPKLFFHYARDLGMNWPLRAGAAVCLAPERTTPESIFRMIAKYRPTVLLNVPTMMRAMLESSEAKHADLSCIRRCLSSGEHLSDQLYAAFTKAFGIEVSNVHGSAEALLGYFVDRAGEVRPGSSGKVAPLVTVKLVDKQGCEVPEGETGVLWVRSAACGTGYHLYPEKSEETFLGDHWINTKDLFREDEDGYFWYMGRANDLMKVSGVYIAPLEIETCLVRHPAIRECTVLGVEDSDGLLKAKAFVVLKDGVLPTDATAAEIAEYCRRQLASYKVPKMIEFVAALPKTGQGKIDKRLLSTRGALAEAGRHAHSAI